MFEEAPLSRERGEDQKADEGEREDDQRQGCEEKRCNRAVQLDN